MSPESRWMCGLSLILVPTIVYGGLTVLGIITRGRFGAPGPPNLQPPQVDFYRAGHAHAGVLTLLNLSLQILIEYTTFPAALMWPIRWAAFAGPILVSAGFFGMAHFPRLRALLYAGAFLVAVTTLITGIGLIRAH